MSDYKKLSRDELIQQLEAEKRRLDEIANEEDIRQPLHELQVHQIELEMQNRELREKQLELEITRDKYADLYDFAPVGYITLDNKGVIREINLTATDLLELTRSQLLNKPFTALLANGYSSDFHRALLRAVKTGEEQSVELKLNHADNLNLDVLLQMLVSINIDGDAVARAAVIDISEKKQAERELMQAKEKAEEASRAKSLFLSHMSHELRTPLNAILGFGQLLERKQDDQFTAHDKDCIQEILNGGRHLLDLINDILDLSRIEMGKLDILIETIDLNAVLVKCMNMIQPLADKVDIRLNQVELNAKYMVCVDCRHLMQAILNLLSNAVKYNRENGEVSLSCQVLSDEYVRVLVEDTGLGIDDEYKEFIFKPFLRGTSINSNIPGTGIGLVITKNIIESMGGKMGFESVLGRGSSFWVDIPLAKAIQI